MNQTYEKLMKSYEYCKKKINMKPKVALVLGSGLGEFAKTVESVAEIPYSEIEGFPVSTVAGHDGRFIFGYIGEVPVVMMKGRVHYYEGYSMQDVVLPIRLMGLFGAEILFLTNASGGVNKTFSAGDFMLITDQISSFVPSPLIGGNMEDLGPRFPELNAILNYSGGSLQGAKLYVCLFPCNECAKAIIQSGIKEVIYDSDKYADTPATIASKKMMDAAGVKYRQYERTGREIKFTI